MVGLSELYFAGVSRSVLSPRRFTAKNACLLLLETVGEKGNLQAVNPKNIIKEAQGVFRQSTTQNFTGDATAYMVSGKTQGRCKC